MKYEFSDYLDVKTHSAVGSSLSHWLRFLCKHCREIEWPFIPRITFITITVLLFTPLRWYEQLRFGRAIAEVKPLSPVFILGYYRSGTTFLHYLMGQDPTMAYASTVDVINPLSFLGSSRIAEWITRVVLPRTRPMDNLDMSPSLPFEEEFALANFSDSSLCTGYFLPRRLQESFDQHVIFENTAMRKGWQSHFLYFVKKLTLKYPGKRLLLKTPANTGRIQAILEVFPDAQFVHIHRDPYKVFQSNEKLYSTILPLLSFHRVDAKSVEAFILKSYQQCYSRFFEERKLLRPGRFVEVSYERFVQNPKTHIQSIYQQLQLPYSDEFVKGLDQILANYINYQTNQYPLDPEADDLVNSHWQFVFSEFGYSQR